MTQPSDQAQDPGIPALDEQPDEVDALVGDEVEPEHDLDPATFTVVDDEDEEGPQ